MDDNAVADPPASADATPPTITIDGVEVAVFSAVVERLRLDYPHVTVTRLETILVREWDAFSAGRPLVVPVAVEEGVREILDAG